MTASTDRIIATDVPQLVGRAPEDYAENLQTFLDSLLDILYRGLPAGFNNVVPTTIQASVAGDPGPESAGWPSASHVHAVDISGTPLPYTGAAATNGVGPGLATTDHRHDIDNNSIVLGKLAQVTAPTLLGRDGAGAGDVKALTPTEATTIPNVFTTALKGLVPAPGASPGTTFLRDDATWAAPGGGGGGEWTRDAGNGWLYPTNLADVVLVGSDTAIYGASSEIVGSVVIRRHSNVPGAGPILDLYRTGGSEGTPTAVSVGDTLGTLGFEGHDGTSDAPAGSITTRAAENWSAGVTGAEMLFRTVGLGGNTVSDRMAIEADGDVVIGDRSAALPTTATAGFLRVPTCAGTPTGTPSSIAGVAPIVIDTTNKIPYWYDHADSVWRAF